MMGEQVPALGEEDIACVVEFFDSEDIVVVINGAIADQAQYLRLIKEHLETSMYVVVPFWVALVAG